MDLNFLFISMVFGAFGTGFFIYGKKEQRIVPLLVGVALCVYPYFMPNNWTTLAVGAVLTAVPFVVRV